MTVVLPSAGLAAAPGRAAAGPEAVTMVPRWWRIARLHEAPAHRADRAALLASAACGMQRIGIAWGMGAPAELLLERACTSLAAAGLSPDGDGPLLGGRSALR